MSSRLLPLRESGGPLFVCSSWARTPLTAAARLGLNLHLVHIGQISSLPEEALESAESIEVGSSSHAAKPTRLSRWCCLGDRRRW